MTFSTSKKSEDLAVLQKYGLDKTEANVIKAQHHAGKAIQSIVLSDGWYIRVVNDQGIVTVHPDARRVGPGSPKKSGFR